MVDSPTVPPATERRGPKRVKDPDRYIRQVKGWRYQARPFDEGVRYDLGIFDTKAAARRAIVDFWWGRLKPLPRFVRCIHSRSGDRYLAIVPVRLGEFDSRDEAAQAVENWVRATFTAAAADRMLGAAPS
jgi:hypothetical protein